MKPVNRKSTFVVLAAIFLATGSVSAQATAPATPVSKQDTGYVTYDDGPISLPLGVGLRIPAYDRVNGLSLPFGPMVTLAKSRFELDPTVTYRSHLGKFDPFGKARIRLSPHDALMIAGGRSTFSNDTWIRTDLVNSLASFGVGSDARNYFRADRVTAELSREIASTGRMIIPRVGFLHENAWSTGSALPHTSAPWSVFGRTGDRKMRRINPSIARGHTTSATAGINVDYDVDQTTAVVDAGFEHAFDAPQTSGANGSTGNFNQFTINAKSSFPTFGAQSFAFRGHAVFTPGVAAPPQRYAYLGGAGTLATVDLLALGGDRLVYVEGDYDVPLRGPLIPFVGPPIIGARYAAGSAGVGSLPDFIQNIGVTVGVKYIKAEYHVDPNYRKTSFSRRHAFSVGLSL